MTDEDALRAGVRAAPLDGTPRLVLADFLDDHDLPEEAALHRVIARRGDEESVRLLAGHLQGDSREAARRTHIANETENRVRPEQSNNFSVAHSAENAIRYPKSAKIYHADTAEVHRVHAGNLFRRAEHIEDEPGFGREASVLRDSLEQHLMAAAFHEAAAYHHANTGAK
jgi:uncharacterized protein (TIGR02996 family)